MYDEMRDTVSWKRSLGESKIPGFRQYGDPVSIPARKSRSIQDIGGDLTSDVQFTVLPEHEVSPQDVIDGAEILKVAEAQDDYGNVLWRTAYGRS